MKILKLYFQIFINIVLNLYQNTFSVNVEICARIRAAIADGSSILFVKML